ncbi:orotidine-5'-phosphate decarboxylase [Arcobacter porcinus]|uniref:orotidine-5'-phosphate decarboxylase n=1 Tax=Arcobacter porcinus TaxID=1935204 RepID=UPI00081DAA1D|nr:orotidine-5'-phosphate decarboxylase [Arcobacter porcinus]OCL81807.1 Orotidine 5'-phosphate decarboxylase [Arcobacter porcinus]OCL82302.1 Orotidine 5'-phosphate decarboxylase [Arcobacter porcinus]
MSNNMKLCVSLDLESSAENLALVEKIKDFDVWIKVGFRTYLRDGKKFLEDIKAINPNFKIFLDLKLYDIPNTMADAAEDISKFGLVDMFNVHASAGFEAMQTVMNRIKDIPNRPLVLAVTALTSFDNESFKKVYGEDIDKKAREFAKNSFEAGLDGVVCSAFESLDIKNNTSKEFITLCPGIRPFGEDSGDQKRVADINFSKNNLVDFIVVGRPIYKNEFPKDIVNKIIENL